MRRTTLTVFAATAVLGLAGCDPAATSTTRSSSPAAPAPPPATRTPGAPNTPAQPVVATLPDLVGKGLQSAQDASQAAGFRHLTSHDALGRARSQIDDRNWKVCAQAPAPGRQSTDVKVDLGAVKLDETCPAADQGTAPPAKAGAAMPDFKGKAASVARSTLDRATSLTVQDASGQARMVIVESNWQVCSQDPAAGTALTGQPVALKVVKFTEQCP
ncbi:hypothetical protein OG689_31020 [Kitasatospora sp. NBC_00240]|uniref:hypothetical protein n=1 Tax=Kitasatospora sp. NBC_00240 TaxID=2903567 RepID=UPI00224EA162|nr:hypothetical protein [Kitasatospora sp. NBC_00240]MCX5213650.1 hypothetical protein [Kitasatospora sp. NBC_00240]